jgi:hypothetical protein
MPIIAHNWYYHIGYCRLSLVLAELWWRSISTEKRELPSIAADAATRNWRDDLWLRFMFADGSMLRLAGVVTHFEI